MQPKIEISGPSWNSVRVTRHLPGELEGLEQLCKNLWWLMYLVTWLMP